MEVGTRARGGSASGAACCVESCRSGVGRWGRRAWERKRGGKWRLGTGSCWKVDGSDGVWLEVKGGWSGEEGTQTEAGSRGWQGSNAGGRAVAVKQRCAGR